MKRGKKIICGRCGCGKPAQLSWFGVKFCYICWEELWKRRAEFKELFKRGKDGSRSIIGTGEYSDK